MEINIAMGNQPSNLQPQACPKSPYMLAQSLVDISPYVGEEVKLTCYPDEGVNAYAYETELP
jgi:hypothetical protein